MRDLYALTTWRGLIEASAIFAPLPVAAWLFFCC